MAASNLTKRIRALEKQISPADERSMAWQRQNARVQLEFEDLFTKLGEPFEDDPEAHALLANDSGELRTKDEALCPREKVFEGMLMSKARKALSELSATERAAWFRRWTAAPDGKGKCVFEIWVDLQLEREAIIASRKSLTK